MMDDNDHKEPKSAEPMGDTDEMSTDGPNSARKKLSRDDLIEISSVAIGKLHGRISGRRFRPKDSDPVLLSFVRAEAQLLTAHNALLRDGEIDEIKQRLEAIEARRK